MRAAALTFFLAALALGACGDGNNPDDSAAPAETTTTEATPTTTTPPKRKPRGASKYSGIARRAYLNARDVCSQFSPSQVTKQFGAPSASPKDAAKAFADGSYAPQLRHAASEGCLAGFK